MKRKQYNTGLIIGRFQPFHKGHTYLLKEALKYCDSLIIAIGSSNKTDSHNPFSYLQRIAMIEAFLVNEQLLDQVKRIIALPDVASDEAWLSLTYKKAGSFDVVIGNNDWVNSIFASTATPILSIPHYKRELYEGSSIRLLMDEQKPWEKRVPAVVVPIIRQ